MKEEKFKPYYRRKGFYKDGRRRIIIEWKINRWDTKSKSLPKPEKMLEILELFGQKILDRNQKKSPTTTD